MRRESLDGALLHFVIHLTSACPCLSMTNSLYSHHITRELEATTNHTYYMTRRLTYILRRDREAEGQQPLFTSAAEDYADRMKAQYLALHMHRKKSKKYPRYLCLYIVFCVENNLLLRAVWGIETLIHYYERVYGFLPPPDVGSWHLKLARVRQNHNDSEQVEVDFLRGLSVYQKNDSTDNREYLMGLRNLAQYYKSHDERQLADQTTRNAFDQAIKSGIDDAELLARFQANVALIHYRAEEHEDAAFHFRHALRRLINSKIEAYDPELDFRVFYAASLYRSDSTLRASLQFKKIADLIDDHGDYSEWGYDIVATCENIHAAMLVRYANDLGKSQRYKASLSAFERALSAFEMMYSPAAENLLQCGNDYEKLLRDLGYEERADNVHNRVQELWNKYYE